MGCRLVPGAEVTPLRDQSASQIDADRARCNEWAKRTAVVTAGYAACMITAGYEAPPGVRSASERVRLARKPTKDDPIIVLTDLLDCDTEGQREAESGFGTVRKAIRDYFGWSLSSSEKRRRVFVGCLKPRGYEIATAR
jgi:hypothetical protein